jgi:hypothetical protein
MVHNGTDNVAKNRREYNCEKCNYNTCKLGDWKKHLETKKHNNSKTVIDNVAKSRPHLICECGKTYKYRSGHYRHKKTCIPVTESATKSATESATALVNFSKQDMIEVMKEIMPAMASACAQNSIITNGDNNTINNQEVTVNLYLNKNCGDAMSIQGFAEQLSLTVNDLLKNGKPIEREGVTNIFIDNLRPLALEDRPIHCVDAAKRSWHINDALEGWMSGKSGVAEAMTAANFNISKSLGKLWDDAYPGWENNEQKTEQFTTLCQMLMEDPRSSDVEKALASIRPECKLSIEDLENQRAAQKQNYNPAN